MAAAPAIDAAAAKPKKGPSLVIQAGVLVALTLMAGGIGFVGGGSLKPPAPAGADAPAPSASAGGHGEKKPDGEHGGGHGEGEAAVPSYPAGQPAVVPLPAITVNLAAPTDTWLRMELAVEFNDGADAGLAAAVGDDIVTYLRTVKLHQIEGPSGLVHLKDDLSERVKIRTEGKAEQVFVRAVLFE